jgi:hypothetical protein
MGEMAMGKPPGLQPRQQRGRGQRERQGPRDSLTQESGSTTVDGAALPTGMSEMPLAFVNACVTLFMYMYCCGYGIGGMATVSTIAVILHDKR